MNIDFLHKTEIEINKICETLFSKTPIAYFHYIKVYANGDALALCSDYRPLFYCVDRNLCPTLECWDIYDDKKIIWSDKLFGVCAFEPIHNSEINQAMKQNYGIDNILNFVQKGSAHYEFFGFASKKDDETAYTFYLSNISTINEFRYFFKEKAFTLIKHFEKNNVYIKLYDKQKKLAGEVINNVFTKNDLNFQPNRYHLSGEFEGITLTKREVQTLRLLGKGMPIKQIAIYLDLSARTVEKYVNRSKEKLHCYSKAQLCERIRELALHDL